MKIEEIRQKISEAEEAASTCDGQRAVFENSIEHNKQTIARILGDKDYSKQNREQLKKEIETEENLISQIKHIASKKRNEIEKVKK